MHYSNDFDIYSHKSGEKFWLYRRVEEFIAWNALCANIQGYGIMLWLQIYILLISMNLRLC